MYLLIILLPLLGSITSLLFGRFLGKGGPIITILNLIFSFFLSILLAYEVIFQYSPVYIKLYNYINFDLLEINIEFIFDQLSVSLLFIIIFISMLVHIYSFEYLASDPHLPRFMGYLSLFTFMMILMVTSNNYFQLFLGWEGVGIASYLLINFWYRRLLANKSAFKAVVYNRFGDLALILALLLIFKVFKSFDFEIINSTLHIADDNFYLFLIGLFIIIAALAKSAQIGLHGWLPDAMEGPTPVSALLHAATMVTAGIYLLIRSQSFFVIQPNLLITMTFIGSLTAFFAASTGLTQNDIKKIIAYSTCSQLGYLFLACGLGQFSISFFHLINHAFFKALLFLAAGCVIHAWAAEGRQDIRYMGSAIHYLPFTYSSFLIGSIALMGFPFLTGFYSKDLIIETAFGGGNYEISSYFSFWLALFTAFLTAFYSIRLLYYTFVSSPFSPTDRPVADNGSVSNNNKLTSGSPSGPHESNIYMSLPLFILSFFSIFFGYLAKDLFVGIGSPIFSSPNNFDSEFIDPLVRLYPFIFSSLGVLTAFYIYSNRKFSYPLNYGANFLNNLYWFFNSKWFFDTIYSNLTGFFLIFAYLIPLKSLDRGFIELLGPTGLSRFSTSYWQSVSNNYQTGYINDMIFGILSVTTAMLIIILGPAWVGPSATGTLIGTVPFWAFGSSSFKIISFLAPWFLSYGLEKSKSEEPNN